MNKPVHHSFVIEGLLGPVNPPQPHLNSGAAPATDEMSLLALEHLGALSELLIANLQTWNSLHSGLNGGVS